MMEMENKDGLNNKIDWLPISEQSYDGNKLNHFDLGFDPFEVSRDYLALPDDYFKIEKKIDRSQETFDQAVARYKDHPADETMEERAKRINRFRGGY